MAYKPSARDPIAVYQRKAKAKRRIGADRRKCVCGESRPEALMPGRNPMVCAACDRERKGHKIMDDHHPAGEANSSAAIPVPVNDHRAILSPAQYEWSAKTLENPEGSPLLAAAGCIRGFCDTVLYLIEKLLLWIADLLEKLDAYLTHKWEPKWWVSTELKQFEPEGNFHGA